MTNVILRGVGLVYLIQFSTILSQLSGLFGKNGLLPADRTLDAFRTLGWYGKILKPTLAWMSTSDLFLQGLCVVGIGLALMIMLGVHRTWLFVVSWIVHSSLIVVSQEFFDTYGRTTF